MAKKAPKAKDPNAPPKAPRKPKPVPVYYHAATLEMARSLIPDLNAARKPNKKTGKLGSEYKVYTSTRTVYDETVVVDADENDVKVFTPRQQTDFIVARSESQALQTAAHLASCKVAKLKEAKIKAFVEKLTTDEIETVRQLIARRAA